MRRTIRLTTACAALAAAAVLTSSTLTAWRNVDGQRTFVTARAVTVGLMTDVVAWVRSPLSETPAFTEAAAQQAVPSVRTDKTDYAPGETAVITGSGFGASEEVTLQVTHDDGTAEGGAGHESWIVVANDAGEVTSSWYVNPDDSAYSALKLIATGASGVTAEWFFTDAPLDPTLGDQSLAGAPSGDGIIPVVWNGNPTCAFFSPGLFESKKDMAGSGYHGTYTMTLGGVSVTFTVTPTANGDVINWSSTLGVTSVFVKGGPGGNLYRYPAEDFGDTGLHAPIVSDTNPKYYGLSHMSFCFDKDLSVSKTAATKLDRTATWSIDKRGENRYEKFVGDAASDNVYSVAVDRTDVDSNWAVNGAITILNDTPDAATLTAVTDGVTGGINATVSCPGGLPQVLASGATLVCGYGTGLPDGADRTNTATVTTSGTVQGGAGTAPVSFATAFVNLLGPQTVTVTDTTGDLGTVGDDNTWNYTKPYTCSTNPSDYGEDGTYAFSYVNTATIRQTGQSATATVAVACYAPLVSKTAATSYTREHVWAIDKSVTPGQLSGFIGGGAGSVTYSIKVDETETESDFTVSGTITVTNPRPSAAMVVNVSDSLPGASLSCGGSLTVPAGGSATCDYEAGTTKTDGTNTATATLNGIPFSAGQAYSFAAATVEIVGAPTIHVSDPNGPAGGPFSDDAEYRYERSFSCSADAGDYTAGRDTDVHLNTATIDETYRFDSAEVTVDCYAPSVAKTATTSYTRKHAWTIDKQVVGQSAFTGFPGQGIGFNYSVAVDETETEFGFTVSGTIAVSNPHPTMAMTVSVADSLPGVTLDCGGSLTVPAGGSASCGYQAATTKTGGTNTAVATINNVSFTASASYAFGDPTTVDGHPVVSVTDTIGALGATDGDRTFTYSVQRGCVDNTFVNGVDVDTYPNTATIDQTGASDSASVTVTCYVPAKAKVVKTTAEGSQPFGGSGFTFALSLGGSDLETASTSGAGTVAFQADLTVDGGSYSVTEALPAGWLNETLVCTFVVRYPASAGKVYECTFHNREVARVTVLKHTEGRVDSLQTWEFQLFAGPNAACGSPTGGATCANFLSTALASSGTFGDIDGVLEFAQINLDPNKVYTVCEIGAPAGWSSLWVLDANRDGVYDLGTEIVTAYNPHASNVPAQDVGTRCRDFAPAAGEIAAFNVNNTFPGGEPRTIGYWKNWNSCSTSGGNQVQVAAKNGGPSAGWFLLDNLLPQTLGRLLVDTCAKGASILSKSSLDGRNRANDGAYELAAQLLAAQLNHAAGAEECQAVADARVAGHNLLAGINFQGTGAYLPSNNKSMAGLRTEALALASRLDTYNNGNLCQ